MPDGNEALLLWVQEATVEIKERKRLHDELRIEFTELKTEVHIKEQTKSSSGDMFWKIMSVVISVVAVTVAIIALIKH